MAGTFTHLTAWSHDSGAAPTQRDGDAATCADASAEQGRLVDRLGPYRLLRLLGRGGMGDVYLAFAPGGRPVALKVLHRRLGRAEALLRFKREAEVLQAIDHPAVLQVLEHGVDDASGEAYVALELVEGRDLEEIVQGRAEARLTPGEVRWVLEGVAGALAAVHARGVIHRDVKPSNVLVTRGGQLKLADFGIALAVDEELRLTQPGGLIGTPFFIAPEVARAGAWSPAADVYALGALAYRVLTGPDAPNPPSHAPLDASELLPSVAASALEVHAPDAPAPLRELIGRLLAAEPAARPTAEELVGELADGRPAGSELSRLRLDASREAAFELLDGPVAAPPSPSDLAALDTPTDPQPRPQPYTPTATWAEVRPPAAGGPDRDALRPRGAWAVAAAALAALWLGGAAPVSPSPQSTLTAVAPLLAAARADIARGELQRAEAALVRASERSPAEPRLGALRGELRLAFRRRGVEALAAAEQAAPGARADLLRQAEQALRAAHGSARPEGAATGGGPPPEQTLGALQERSRAEAQRAARRAALAAGRTALEALDPEAARQRFLIVLGADALSSEAYAGLAAAREVDRCRARRRLLADAQTSLRAGELDSASHLLLRAAAAGAPLDLLEARLEQVVRERARQRSLDAAAPVQATSAAVAVPAAVRSGSAREASLVVVESARVQAAQVFGGAVEFAPSPALQALEALVAEERRDELRLIIEVRSRVLRQQSPPAVELTGVWLRLQDRAAGTVSAPVQIALEGGPFLRPVVLERDGRRRVLPFERSLGLDPRRALDRVEAEVRALLAAARS